MPTRQTGAGDKAYSQAPYADVIAINLIMNAVSIIIDPSDIIECYFIEDILSPAITGKIVFNDRVGISEFGPITGTEIIVIQYGLEEFRTLPFPVQKINFTQSGSSQTGIQYLVEMYFADPLYEYLGLRKFSRSFGNQSVSEIVTHIIKYMLKEPDIGRWEESETRFNNFVVPYWSPANTLNWIGKRARSSLTDNPGFLYYNSTQEGFRANWITFDKLFHYNIDHKDKDIYVMAASNELYKNTILEWWSEGIDRFFMRFIKGGSYLGYKFNGKEFLKRDYDYSTSIGKTKIMGRKSLFRDESDPRIKYELTGQDTEEGLDLLYYSEWFRKYNTQQMVNFIVRGHESRYAGMQMEVDWPDSTEPEVASSKMRKGNYLIKSITHQFVGGQSNVKWRQRIVALKNGYENVDHTELVKASLMNVAGEMERK